MGLPVKFVLFLFLQWVCLRYTSEASTPSSIPPILLSCYQNNNVTNSIPRIPLNVQVLTELIRKLEFDIGNAMNIRILTNALLHSLRLDGIERTAPTSTNEFAFPFRASGKQFHKFRFIVDHLTPGDGLQFPADAVSVHERCLLHFMISNTIDSWERGDEATSCQVRSMDLREKRQVISLTQRQRSACPIEKGVVKTRWGTVSPSHLIAGLASVYHANPIQFKEVVDDLKGEVNITQTFRENTTSQMVNSLLVSTVVGDLAEVILNQPIRNPAFGNPGYWNNTIYPRAYYLNKIQWDMTSAELLGGLDGLLLSNKILEWTSILQSTRLSQVIDMFYSERGIGYDRKYRACERNSKLAQLFSGGVDLVSETSAAAKLLQEIGQFNEYIYEEGIDALAKDVVENYRHIADGLTRKYDACEQGGDNITKLEIITILDGTWQPYEIHSLISYLAELADVSYYGSTLGVINGQSGNWMVNVTTDVIKIFGALSNVTSWPSTLQLSTSLHTIINYYQNQTRQECQINYARPMGHVILVLANTALITDVDATNTQAAIRSLKSTLPEIRIIFVASETNAGHYERIASDDDYVIKSSNSIGVFVGQISAKLNNLPASFMNFYCNNSEVRMEDYVTPGVNTLYELHSEYVRRVDISVKFKGYDYADISVCAYDSNSPHNTVCRGITGNAEVNFTARDYCPPQHACTVQFSVSANNTRNRCAERDCRYPDQARLDIMTSWRSRSSSFTTPNLVLLSSAFAYTLVFIRKSYS